MFNLIIVTALLLTAGGNNWQVVPAFGGAYSSRSACELAGKQTAEALRDAGQKAAFRCHPNG